MLFHLSHVADICGSSSPPPQLTSSDIWDRALPQLVRMMDSNTKDGVRYVSIGLATNCDRDSLELRDA